MHLLIRARSGGLIVKTDAYGCCAMDLVEGEDGRYLPLAGETVRRGMLSYILGEVARVHTGHSSAPLFHDEMRERMLERMRVRIVREPFCHTVFGQHVTKVLPSKIRIDDFGWKYANRLIGFLRPQLTKVTGCKSLGDVNAALQDALSLSAARQRRYFVALRKKTEGKELKEADHKALAYREELMALVPPFDGWHRDVKIERKLFDYFEDAVGFVERGFTGKKVPVSELHLALLRELREAAKDPAWRRDLSAVKSTKFSILIYPVHTAQWVDVPQENVLYVRGYPLIFATSDFDLVVPNLSDAEKERVLAGPMSCFYARWGTGTVSLHSSLQLDEFDDNFPSLSEDSLKAAGVEFPRQK